MLSEPDVMTANGNDSTTVHGMQCVSTCFRANAKTCIMSISPAYYNTTIELPC